MKKILSIILLLGIFQTVFSQIQFEKGFFIDNNNKKTDCLIKNKDWDYNPSEISYKLNENEEAQSIDISLIKEFSIYNFSKYIKANVKIDRSSINLDEIDYDKNPKWSEETLFLKVLIEGKASLYLYKEGSIKRFFYKKDSLIQQLVQKDYYVDKSKLSSKYHASGSNDKQIATNNLFQRQLWINVRCKNTSTQSLENMGYSKGELIRYFKQYNKCQNANIIDYSSKGSKSKIHLKIVTGVSNFNFTMYNFNSFVNSTSTFDNKIIFKAGLEAEIMLPINKNKWAVIFAPEYYNFYFKNEQYRMEYHRILLPLGIRYYMYLNDNSKFFIGGLYIPNYCIKLNSEIQGSLLTLKDGYNTAYGLGFEHKIFSVEVRYFFKRDLFDNYISRDAILKGLQLNFGYKLF